MKIKEEPKATLPKILGWSILIILVLLDATLDLIFVEGRGLESPIWRPIATFLNVNNPLFLTPLVLLLFYFVVKSGAWLTRKIDKIQNKSEELVLTTLVIVYGLFDLWLISVYFFNFELFNSHYYLIPVLILAGTIYEWWAGKKLKE